ncbi:unnamed protein product [Miscanthus lutarioriparius]|uniref:RRM domain-containing protein n=1 Tax=Miscanthus lutarioriparius TaxID=422564 RepID=A0A811Q1V2_9POAL|nr:unnamed protein product [Miscanthus lutarioriparius]
MGGGDANAFRRVVERARREFNRLHIQPQRTTQQFDSSFMDPQAMPELATLFARRVYVGGLPPSANEQICSSGIQIGLTEEASNAMAQDDILFEGSAGGWLEDPDRIFVGGLPYFYAEAQVRELLESFGPLREFDLVKDRETGNSKGYAFCVYLNTTVTDIACAALNGTNMEDKTLTVRRANQSASQPRPELLSILLKAQGQVQMQKLANPVGAAPTKVVCLVQVVSAEELKDDEAYEDIKDDMRQEACRYGNLVKVVIPRPDPSGHPVTGVGKVFLEYADVYSATRAKMALHGRKFDGKPVVASYYPELKFANLDFDG